MHNAKEPHCVICSEAAIKEHFIKQITPLLNVVALKRAVLDLL